MKRVGISMILLATALCAQQPPAAQPTPQTMTKMVVQRAGSDIPHGSFAFKPKTFYRSGTTYCRVEEQPQPEKGLHGVVIINEPDIWMVNLADETARHFVDSGPDLNCHMRIFDDHSIGIPEEVAKQISGLEFGFEMEFFKSHGAVPEPGPVLEFNQQPRQTIGYRLQFGDWMATLFTFGLPERPAAVAMVHGDKDYTWYYSGYGQVDFDATLFARPTGVKIEEGKQ